MNKTDFHDKYGCTIVHYEYYPTGGVKTVTMGNSLTLTYTYHISGAVKTAAVQSADGNTLYSETLYYEDCGGNGCTPQYNGNISRMVHELAHGNADFSQYRDVAYAYDQLNRLKNADDIEQDYFDEVFEYDAQGRMTVQRRDTSIAKNEGGEYSYYANTNRFKSVANGMGGTADDRIMSDASNFVYDSEGNLIEDKSKNMKIFYDWRGMPVEFVREADGGDSLKLVMAYDGSGKRISKTRLRKIANATEWSDELTTHYTGIGTEIRTNNSDGETKVVINMPQGLGRYAIEYADVNDSANAEFEWYLKNHLGSTMAVYRTTGTTAGPPMLQHAYDYRSYGEKIDLTVLTDKVTENYTGKELDDETLLSNHGARLLDPMLGMWISVDLARFFTSPYLYMGNGYNPIKFADLNGMKPGDPFNSTIEAAQDFARLYNDDAIRNNVEYSSAIYSYKKDGVKIYSYNVPIRGDISSARFDNTIDLTKGQSFETTVHAHGAYLDDFELGNDVPSPQDFNLNFNVFRSKGSAFVSGPSGYLLRYGSDVKNDLQMEIVPTSGIAADCSSPRANPKGADPFANPVDDAYR